MHIFEKSCTTLSRILCKYYRESSAIIFRIFYCHQSWKVLKTWTTFFANLIFSKKLDNSFSQTLYFREKTWTIFFFANLKFSKSWSKFRKLEIFENFVIIFENLELGHISRTWEFSEKKLLKSKLSPSNLATIYSKHNSYFVGKIQESTLSI